MRTGTGAGCLQRRRKRGALFEPHPKDAFWILLLHCLLDKGNVAFRYQSNLRRLAVSAQADDELAQVAESLCLTGWEAAKMIDRVRSGDWPMLNRLARHLKKYEVRWQPLERILQSTATSVAILSSRSVRRY